MESNRQLRATNEKLREADELKSEFLRNTNHEVRTPLCIMNGYLDMLNTNAELPPTCREYVDVLRQQVASLQGMLLNLIDYSKLLVDDLEVKLRHGDPVGALISYYESRRPGIAVELREFKFSAASQSRAALCDPDRVVQIVEALVDNAVKHTPQGSHIHLRVDNEERDGTTWLAVRVEDDGPGIPADRLPRIFESFVQGDGSVTREVGGMGLGLSLAKSLAEKMRGCLEVTSEIGRGTTFTLLLPTG
jgi:signal transduction histidine kinase